jgi:hypothetical protein
MVRRFILILGVALLLQATAFAVYYDDLLYLRRTVPAITGGPAHTFTRHAERALGRTRLTRKHLDTIADSAQVFGLHAIEIAALERRSAGDQADRGVRLRLADALRRDGQFDRAESVYLAILTTTGDETR